MSRTLAVSCTGIRKVFGSGANVVQALRGIDLEVSQGECMLLVGPSGCGKTTLISIIAGILNPSAGECSVLGTPLQAMRRGELISFRGKNIGFIFQQYNLLPALSILDNVAVPLIINKIPARQAKQRAREVLTEVGLGQRLDDLPNKLSGGQQQRVAIARALVHEPGLLVCDEPTSALDHETGQRIMELMRRAVESRGTTLLVVTHDNRIFGYADRIARMDDGMIIGIDQPKTPIPHEEIPHE